jgi:predicted aspartyl protease
MRALLVLVFLFIGAIAARAEECILQRVVTLESPQQYYGHLMIPVTIADHPSHLLVDTGGAWSMLDKAFAQALGLEIRSVPSEWGSYHDASGDRIANYARVPSMKIGNLPVKGAVDFLLAPLSKGRPPEEIGGSIGLNFLSHYDLEIDNAHHLVTIFLSTNVENCGVHWADEAASFHFIMRSGIPFTRANVDGEDVDALIDTGSSTTVLDIDFARRHYNLTPDSPGVTSSGQQLLPGGNLAHFYRAMVNKLSVSGIQFENVPVELADLDDTRLILGMNELKRLHLYFAFKMHTIYATAADATHDPAPVAAPAPATSSVLTGPGAP